MTAAFESHGMDLRWQGWVASVYGIISFFVGPVSVRSTREDRDPFLRLRVFVVAFLPSCLVHGLLQWQSEHVSTAPNASFFIFNEA